MPSRGVWLFLRGMACPPMSSQTAFLRLLLTYCQRMSQTISTLYAGDTFIPLVTGIFFVPSNKTPAEKVTG